MSYSPDGLRVNKPPQYSNWIYHASLIFAVTGTRGEYTVKYHASLSQYKLFKCINMLLQHCITRHIA